MDRNFVQLLKKETGPIVALRKESVDRNIAGRQLPATEPPSLSARRAWIEIARLPACFVGAPVALRKESVDRNTITAED